MFHFSYTQEIYDEIKEHGRRYLGWTNKEKTWHYRYRHEWYKNNYKKGLQQKIFIAGFILIIL